MCKIFSYIFLFFLLSTNLLISQSIFSSEIFSNGKHNEKRNINILVEKNGYNFYTVNKEIKPNGTLPEATNFKSGELALINSIEGKVEFYNTSAEKIFEENLYKLPPYKEQNIKYVANDLGLTILVSEENENTLIIFTPLGNKIFSRKLEPGIVAGLSSSTDGEKYAYSIFNWEGSTFRTRSIFININEIEYSEIITQFKKGIFNENNTLFLGFTNRNSFCYNIDLQKIIWQKKLNEKDIFLDATFHDNTVLFFQSENPKLINGKWLYSGGSIIEKIISGNEIVKQQINKNFNEIEIIKNQKNQSLKLDRTYIIPIEPRDN